jgi:hypothetical protein
MRARARHPRARAVLGILVVELLASRAGATPAVCRDAVIAASARYTQSAKKALASCRRRRVADCDADTRTVSALARAAARLQSIVTQRCCGSDRICGTADDEPLAAIGWDSGYCPNLDRGECNGLITSAADVATCLTCIGNGAAGDLAAASAAGGPASGPAGGCVTAIGKETARLATTTSKALARCWEARGKGTHANSCPEPGDGLAGPAIESAVARATTRLCKACGGPDHACGGTDDLAPASLGFASSCPDVTVPGGATCGGTITTLADLVGCVTCVTAHDSECADHAAAPAFVPYPSACAAPPGTCGAGIECASGADCPAGYRCLDNGSGTTRYCVGGGCSADTDCDGGAVCRQYCTFAGCESRRCVCPGFACGASEVCIDDGGLACRQLCTQDSDCPPPLGVCVNSTFASGLCISSSPCQ